jgi:hypothetical protein
MRPRAPERCLTGASPQACFGARQGIGGTCSDPSDCSWRGCGAARPPLAAWPFARLGIPTSRLGLIGGAYTFAAAVAGVAGVGFLTGLAAFCGALSLALPFVAAGVASGLRRRRGDLGASAASS